MDSIDKLPKNYLEDPQLSQLNTSPSLKGSVLTPQQSPRKLNHRKVGDFHSQYLELGQWPQLSFNQQVKLRRKYRTLREEVERTKQEKQTLKEKLKQRSECDNCQVLKEKERNTRQALNEAVELSNALLKKVYELDKRMQTNETPKFKK